MNKFKEALIKFAHSNPSLFQNDDTSSYSKLIEQRFSQFFPDFQTPNHPPYAAMIHKAIWELNEQGGSSEESISKYIKQEYVDLPWAHSTLLKHHLEKLCDREEICLTHSQCYSLAGGDLDPISSPRSEKRSKMKQDSESGKKSSRKRKKHKSRQDSETGKTHSRKRNKVKRKEEQNIEDFQEQDQVLQPLDKVTDNKQIIETFQEQDQVDEVTDSKQIIEAFQEQDQVDEVTDNKRIIEAFQEQDQDQDQVLQPLDEVTDNKQIIEDFQEQDQDQDQVLQLLDEVTDEKENSLCNGLHEPETLNIEDGTNEQVNGLVDIYVQEVEEDVIHAIAAGQNLLDIGKDGVVEKACMITHGTKKGQLKRKQTLKSKTRSSKRVKKHEINGETNLQVLSEANSRQHSKVTDGESHKQNQITEVNTSDTQIPDQNEVGRSVNDGSAKRLERRKNVVAGEVNKDGESGQESHPEKDGHIGLGQIQKVQNPQLLQLEESPDSNPVLLKSKHPGKQVWTRSQLKTKKDASASSKLMESPGYANMPKDKQHVKHLSEEKEHETQTIGGKEEKQAPSAVSNQRNGQRAKLRSSQKTTSHLEIVESVDMPLLQMEQQKPRSPSLDRPLKELVDRMPQLLPDLDEPIEVQEQDNSQPDQQPDESEDQLKYQGSGRKLQTKKIQKLLCKSESADISLHSHADEDKPKYRGRGRPPKIRKAQNDKVLSDTRSAAIPEKSKVHSMHPKAKRVKDKVLRNSKHHEMHKMTRRSTSKKKNRSR